MDLNRKFVFSTLKALGKRPEAYDGVRVSVEPSWSVLIEGISLLPTRTEYEMLYFKEHERLACELLEAVGLSTEMKLYAVVIEADYFDPLPRITVTLSGKAGEDLPAVFKGRLL